MSKRRRSRSARAAKAAPSPKRRPPAPVFELTRVIRPRDVADGDRPTPLLEDQLAVAAHAFERAAAESWGYGPSVVEPAIEALSSTPSPVVLAAAPAAPAVVTERMHVVPIEPPPSTRPRRLSPAVGPSLVSPSPPPPTFLPSPADPPLEASLDAVGAEPEPWSTSPRRIARKRRSQGVFALVMGMVCALGVLATLRTMRDRAPVEDRGLASTLVAPPLTVLRALEPPLPLAMAEAPTMAARPTVLPTPETPPMEEAAPDPAAVRRNAKALGARASQALELGKTTLAIELATRAVEADETEARPYLVWGTALLERGRRAEAKEVFARCAERATRGPRAECKLLR